MKSIPDEKYGSNNQYVDWYLPETDSFDLIIWFHGGGLESGWRKDIRFADDLVKKNIAVCSVEYSLYPDAAFPSYIVDCAKAVKYCLTRVKDFRKGGRVFISGQSAGAYITLMLCMDGHYLADEGVDCGQIDGFISDSTQTTTHFNVLRERGLSTTYERIDEAAPLYFVSEKSKFNGLLLLCYENDIPCRVAQNVLLKESLERHGHGDNLFLKVLSGGHTNGSANRNERGTFDFVDEVCDFIKATEKG